MKIVRNIFFIHLLAGFALLNFSCHRDPTITSYKTRNVVIVMIDGPRYSETWGETSHQNIPHLVSIVPNGVFCTGFYNDGITNTINGHTAIVTGHYGNINNSGLELPEYPTLFQYYLEASREANDKAWVVSSKDKLAVLNNCEYASYKNKFNAFTDCGVNGNQTGYREDTTTLRKALNVLRNYKPHLIMIHFKEPDATAHAGDSLGYINGIVQTDIYFQQIWDYLQTDPLYSGKTTIFLTNDHGRHLGNAPNWWGHGDGCDGCRHINFFAAGPDFKKNMICTTRYQQIDISATIGELLGFKMPLSSGVVMKDLFKEN